MAILELMIRYNVSIGANDGYSGADNQAYMSSPSHAWCNIVWNTKEVIRISRRGRLGLNTTGHLTTFALIGFFGALPICHLLDSLGRHRPPAVLGIRRAQLMQPIVRAPARVAMNPQVQCPGYLQASIS